MHYCSQCHLKIASGEPKRSVVNHEGTEELHFHEYDGNRCYTAYVVGKAHEQNTVAHSTPVTSAKAFTATA